MGKIIGADGQAYVIGKVDSNGHAMVAKIPEARSDFMTAARMPDLQPTLQMAQNPGLHHDSMAHASPDIAPNASGFDSIAHAAPGISPNSGPKV